MLSMKLPPALVTLCDLATSNSTNIGRVGVKAYAPHSFTCLMVARRGSMLVHTVGLISHF